MTFKPLYWDASYEIVLELISRYPDADIEAIGLHELNNLIVNLPNFLDDPMLANEKLLNDILREWYEECNS